MKKALVFLTYLSKSWGRSGSCGTVFVYKADMRNHTNSNMFPGICFAHTAQLWIRKYLLKYISLDLFWKKVYNNDDVLVVDLFIFTIVSNFPPKEDNFFRNSESFLKQKIMTVHNILCGCISSLFLSYSLD